MEHQQALTLYFQYSTFTLLLVQAGILWRDARDLKPARYGILVCFAVAALAIEGTVDDLDLPVMISFILYPLTSNVVICLWLFSLSLLDDDFHISKWMWGVTGIWLVAGFIQMPDVARDEPLTFVWASYVRFAIGFGIGAHIIYMAWRDRRSDLVEKRRRFRANFAIAIAVVNSLNLLFELVFGLYLTPALADNFLMASFLAVVLWSTFWLWQVSRPALTFETPPPMLAPAQPALSPKEDALKTKLMTAMDNEKLWLHPDMSIGNLAQHLETPEHHLRALINKSMGHRNFRAFLNEYRLTAAQEALRDPEKAGLPILTIAMDVGFASLASFNRAFKEATGKTPSTFRKTAEIDSQAAQN